MKLHARNLVWLLPFFLTGCFNRPHPQPVQQFAPPVSTVPKPPPVHPELPESATAIPSEPLDTDTDAILDEAAKKVVRPRRPAPKTPAEGADDAQSAPGGAQQAEKESNEVPAIGTFSSGGDPSNTSDMRNETLLWISDTERDLKNIHRSLNAEEQKTVAQIRQYIKQARKALSSGDVEGAHTLAAKGKALLTELIG
jgi:hypothetical protein